MRAILAWSGAAVTAALAIAALARSSYRAEHCFVFAGGGGGCDYLSLPLTEMVSRFPSQLVGPALFVAALTALAAGAAMLVRARPEMRVVGAALLGAHAALALPTAGVAPAPFALAVPFLAAAYASSLLDAVVAAAVGLVASVAGPPALARAYEVVPVIYGFRAAAPAYWAFAAAVGIGVGAAAVAAGMRHGLSRALAGAFLTLAVAAALAHLALVPAFYPRGVYENPGGPGVFVIAFWLAVPNALLGPLALRVGLGTTWRVAIVTTVLAFAALAFAIGLTVLASPILRPAPS